jgi:hypothetical protein
MYSIVLHAFKKAVSCPKYNPSFCKKEKDVFETILYKKVHTTHPFQDESAHMNTLV